MNYSRFGDLLKEADEIITMLLEEYPRIINSDYKDLKDIKFREALNNIGKSLEHIQIIQTETETRRKLISFYFLTLLKNDEKFRFLIGSTTYDYERLEFERKNPTVAKDASFKRFFNSFKSFYDNCIRLEDTVEKAVATLKSMEKEVFSLIRKNYRTRFKKSFNKDGHLITFDVPITIRFAHGGVNSEKNVINALDFFIGEDLKLDKRMIEDYAFMLNHSLEEIFENKISMFQPIYGNKISFNLMIDLIDLDSWYGSVMGWVRKEYKGNPVFIARYDHTYKNIEISINCIFLHDSIMSGDFRGLNDVMIHEFNHLFDSKINIDIHSDLIRNEGIATFSEVIFNKSRLNANEKIIRRFKQNPLDSVYEYEKSASKGNKIPYILGAYMCYTMFIYYLSFNNETKKIIEYTKNVGSPESRIESIMSEPAVRTAGENFMRIVRRLSAAEFYSYYLKAEKSAPIITKQFLDIFMERMKR